MSHTESPAAEDRLAALRAEFPGWTIEYGDLPSLPYRAVREGGGDKALVLGAGTCDGLRGLLAKQDEADCERALLALGKALEERGAKVVQHGGSLITRTRTGTARSVGADRGRFIWDSGNGLGSFSAVDEVALKITRLLGLELHPQLATLARRMGVRGYKVDIGAPEITVAADGGGTPRAVRVTCEARPTDNDRDWFWTHWGDPIAEATDITGAEVALAGLLARP
ncbi:hypothetical protein [Actinomadura mexicana]|uniref:Uncharacterized protein n=1 Tax=Actinomadura mexicana TaxID=134959 RepID=A0A238YBI1_9ACTN|nr:hypothetical protein [Actinomadura mexicana]SNR68322.1 hypothetical protein SAMN06265355_105405 [Actinomadura mexicana]